MTLKYAATGFLHVRRSVFVRMAYELDLPRCNEKPDSLVLPFFLPLVVGDVGQKRYLGEDYAFCERAGAIGVPVFADTRIRLWHFGDYPYGWEDAGSDKQRFDNYEFQVLDKRSG